MAMVRMVSKVKSEKGSAKSGEGPAIASVRDAEHEMPPALHLSHEHLKKLNLTDLKAGQELHLRAVARIHHASSEATSSPPSGGKAKGGEGNTKHTATLHFHQMEVGKKGIDGSPEVDQEAQTAKGAKAEMDKALKRGMGGDGRDAEGSEGAQDRTPRGGED